MLPELIGVGAAAAAGVAGYGAMYPTAQLFGRTLCRGKNPKQLALTYDDGPNDPHTLRLLEVLAKHGVKATFFLIGKYVSQRPDLVREISKLGHEIGNHTQQHPNLAFVSSQRLLVELLLCEMHLLTVLKPEETLSHVEAELTVEGKGHPGREKLLKMLGSIRMRSGTRWFRPPFGGRNPQTLSLARAAGYEPVMWSVTCYDWKTTSADKVESHAQRQIRGGDVILLHDGGHREFGADRAHSVQATDRLITRYKDKGFEFVTVGQLAGGN